MDKQRILKEAQRIAHKFSFWMVSGNIAHLFGYVLETLEAKYEMEIKFGEAFPDTPPQFVYREAIQELLGNPQLQALQNWKTESFVVDALHELKAEIQEALSAPQVIAEQDLVPIIVDENTPSSDYVTPDFNAYPSDDQYITPSSGNESYESQPTTPETYPSTPTQVPQPTSFEEDQTSLAARTELSLIQQEYAYDQKGASMADINVYMTITLTKTFLIHVNFVNYPERPTITLPSEVSLLLGDPYETVGTLKKWNKKKPKHIVEVLRDVETKLYFIKDIDLESKKILGEYQADHVAGSVTKLKVHLLTYGFKEYLLDVDLGTYPKPPEITLSSELQQIIQTPLSELNSVRNWVEKQSEPVEVIREFQWLVDKNSRIQFEIELLKANYKDIVYNPATADAPDILRIDMKGKMKTQDLTFEFEIRLPREYPMKTPEIKVLNEFDIDIYDKIKNDLQGSFNDFFAKWSPFSYLVDLFNEINKNIFEISVVSCVICHKIPCPTCSIKIAGENACHVECPYCERAYHKHCWDQTIRSFGKCGFCLKTPPPNLMP